MGLAGNNGARCGGEVWGLGGEAPSGGQGSQLGTELRGFRGNNGGQALGPGATMGVKRPGAKAFGVLGLEF